MDESAIGLFETGAVHRRRTWCSLQDVESGTEWVWRFNAPLLEHMGHIPPAEFEEAYYRGSWLRRSCRHPRSASPISLG
jgi:putative transposase